MIAGKYFEFCENLHINWDLNKLNLGDNFGFDLNALPEPYLNFGSNGNDICFLTTNPGGVMDFQKKPSDFFKNGEKYPELSRRLAKHYENTLQGPAKTRIQAMYKISNMIRPNSNGFMQFEISPFHSSSFPNKEKFANFVLTGETNFHSEYVDLLTEQLKDSNCICIQSGLPDLKRLNKMWLQLIGKILSVDKNSWETIYFKHKDERPTTGAFYNKNKNTFKAILFNSGSNSIPNVDSMNELINRLRY
jgi:hypothetical protein